MKAPVRPFRILALDLGTHAGIAVNAGTEFHTETYTSAKDKEITQWRKERLDRRQDPRILRFQQHLLNIRNVWGQPDVVIFEDVQFQSYTLQTQLWSSFRTAVWLTFPWWQCMECVPTGTLKLFATGHGGATKEMMAKHLKAKHPEWVTPGMDDNAVDAAWLWLWAQRNLSRLKTV